MINLEKDGWYVVKVILCNKNGFPDLILFKGSKSVFFEIKSQNKEAKKLQEHRHKELQAHGFTTFVIDTWDQYLKIKYLL